MCVLKGHFSLGPKGPRGRNLRYWICCYILAETRLTVVPSELV